MPLPRLRRLQVPALRRAIRGMTEPTLTDWLSVIIASVGIAIAAWAAFVGLRTFQHQQTTNDVSLALTIFEQINRYWDRADEEFGNRNYNFGQILAYFEVASGLFNDKVLTEQARKILKDHIVEVFASLQSSEAGRDLLEHCRSSGNTFSELNKLAKTHFPEALLAQAFSATKSAATVA